MDSLTADDFVRILTETENAQTKQYAALLGTEGVQLTYTEDGVRAIADYAFEANQNGENLGARRLHGIMEQLLEEVSFCADEMQGEIVVDSAYVQAHLERQFDVNTLRKYIL